MNNPFDFGSDFDRQVGRMMKAMMFAFALWTLVCAGAVITGVYLIGRSLGVW